MFAPVEDFFAKGEQIRKYALYFISRALVYPPNKSRSFLALSLATKRIPHWQIFGPFSNRERKTAFFK